ncbi:MAG: hypothetical protein IID42_01175 [Planctomycetes bacterium]|nr:hypothetical protein [Planctomycetota bacterium]
MKTLDSRSAGTLIDKSATGTPDANNLILPCVSLVASYSVAVFIFRPPYTIVSAINLLFYLLLMFHTYVSLSFTESVYRVRCLSDGIINLPLVTAYLALPWLVHRPFWFFLVLGAFFCVAMMRYANWINLVDGAFFLRRKIFANGLAGTLCLAAAAAIHVLEVHASTITLVATIVFAYANVHTLWLDPLYREK